jgi:hypothetical protein
MGDAVKLVPGCAVMEVLDFSLRGGQEAKLVAAAGVDRVTERYLPRVAVQDISAAVSEIVAWLAEGDQERHTLRLEVSVTLAVVRVSVTTAQPIPLTPTSNELLREALPVTAVLASRYGVEASQRTRVWAEFDRCSDFLPAS